MELINKVASAAGEKHTITDDWSGNDYDSLQCADIDLAQRQGFAAQPQLQARAE